MKMQATREWGYAIGGHIRITERAFTFDYAGKHDAIALSEIVGVERRVTMPFVAANLIIKHRAGELKIPSVTAKAAKEIVSALGF